ncbi:MAG: hypothetical protein WC822_07545, partial [Candidatus Paceibacterota bacterium]
DYPFTLRFLNPTTSYQLSAVIDLNLNERTDPGEPNAYTPGYTLSGSTASVLTIMDPGQMAGGNIGEIRGMITYGGHQGGSKIVRLFQGGFYGAPMRTQNVDAFCLGNSCDFTLGGLPLANDYYVDAFVDTSFNGQFEPASEPSGRMLNPIALTQRGPATAGTVRAQLYGYSLSQDTMQVPVRVATYAYSASVNYLFPDLPAGNYMVRAYADYDGDYVMDSTEAWGQTRSADNGVTSVSPAEQRSFSICARSQLSPGQNFNGSLDSTDCLSSERQAYADYYSFSETAGDIVTVDMLGTGFSDTYLYLYGPVVNGTGTYSGGANPAANAYSLLAADDDGAGNANSRLNAIRLPANGVYTIGAASYGNNITGAYTLSLRVSGGSNGSIAGTVRYNGTQGGAINVGLFSSDPMSGQGAEPMSGTSMNAPGGFSFADLPVGTSYYIGAFIDVNGNSSPDQGEDTSIYPDAITLRSGQAVTGIIIEINPSTAAVFVGGAGQGTISGQISYAGASAASSLVIEMWNTATFRGMPVGIRTLQVTGEWPLSYDLQVPGDQTYYLKAFLDGNDNRMPDADEAKGAYQPNNEGPEPIYVGSAAYVSNRDFALYDAGQAVPGGASGAAGEGWASVYPSSVPAGSQFTSTVVVRLNGLGAGGVVMVGMPNNLYGSLTTGCSGCQGDVMVSLDGTTYNTVGLTIPLPPPGSFMPPNTAMYAVPAGGLAAGTSVYFAIRNLYAPCQGGAGPMGAVQQANNTMTFHVGTSSNTPVPAPLVNGEPSFTLAPGAPANISFRLADNSNGFSMSVPNGDVTAMLAEARDNCWNLAPMASVYIATVGAYSYNMATYGYDTQDTSVKFSSWSASAGDISANTANVFFETGSSTGAFYIKPTAQGYRNIGLAYDLGMPNTF